MLRVSSFLSLFQICVGKGKTGYEANINLGQCYLDAGNFPISRTTGIFITRDLKITHPVRLRRFRLKFNGIGRRGFNQQKKGRQD